MKATCRFFNGEISKVQIIEISLDDFGLRFSQDYFWHFDEIEIIENFDNHNFAIISHKVFIDARLQINDVDFFNEIKSQLAKKNNFSNKFLNQPKHANAQRVLYQSKIDKNLVRNIALSVATICLLVLLSIALINNYATKISPQEIEHYSNLAMKNIIKFHDNICRNSQGQIAADNLVKKITKNRDYKIFIVKNDQINAVVLPNKKIIIYSALLEKLSSANQLAYIVAHEIGHIENNHHQKLLALNIFISNLFSDYAKIITYFASLKYSRSDEIEADLYALKIGDEHNIDKADFISLMEILKKNEFGSSKLTTLISTHPEIDERIEIAKKLISSEPIDKKKGLKITSEEDWLNIKKICSKK